MRRSAERKQGATSLQTTGHGNRAVVRNNQIPSGRNQEDLRQPHRTRKPQRSNQGGGQGKGEALPEKKRRRSRQSHNGTKGGADTPNKRSEQCSKRRSQPMGAHMSIKAVKQSPEKKKGGGRGIYVIRRVMYSR